MHPEPNTEVACVSPQAAIDLLRGNGVSDATSLALLVHLCTLPTQAGSDSRIFQRGNTAKIVTIRSRTPKHTWSAPNEKLSFWTFDKCWLRSSHG